MAYIEIYNEKLNDLLSREAKEVKIREDYHGNIIVTSTEVVVTNTDEILEKLQYGNRNRQTGETNMNERSSRGHAIFKIVNKLLSYMCKSKLNLCRSLSQQLLSLEEDQLKLPL